MGGRSAIAIGGSGVARDGEGEGSCADRCIDIWFLQRTQAQAASSAMV